MGFDLKNCCNVRGSLVEWFAKFIANYDDKHVEMTLTTWWGIWIQHNGAVWNGENFSINQVTNIAVTSREQCVRKQERKENQVCASPRNNVVH